MFFMREILTKFMGDEYVTSYVHGSPSKIKHQGIQQNMSWMEHEKIGAEIIMKLVSIFHYNLVIGTVEGQNQVAWI